MEDVKYEEMWETDALKRRLTPEQIELVRKKSKSPEERPSYYRAPANKTIQITKNFENFLILAPNDFKEKATKLIDSYKATDEWEVEKRNITSDVLTKDSDYIDSVLAELEEKIVDYKNFRNSFSDLKYSDAPEVGYMMEDLQQGSGLLYYYHDRFFHLKKFYEELQKRETAFFDSENFKEVQSWRGPLISYSK